MEGILGDSRIIGSRQSGFTQMNFTETQATMFERTWRWSQVEYHITAKQLFHKPWNVLLFNC